MAACNLDFTTQPSTLESSQTPMVSCVDYCYSLMASMPDGPSPCCECSGTLLEDGNSGTQIGECLTTNLGRYWCYVNPGSQCKDKFLSSRSTRALKLYVSYEACRGS